MKKVARFVQVVNELSLPTVSEEQRRASELQFKKWKTPSDACLRAGRFLKH